MALFYHLPPWMEQKAQKEAEAKDAKRKAFRSYVSQNPDFTARLQENSTVYGFLPTDTIVGASLYGLDPNRPEWDAIVDRWLQNEAAEQSKFKEAGKGALRLMFTGLQSMADAVDKGYKANAKAMIDRGMKPWNIVGWAAMSQLDPTYGDDVVNYYKAQPKTPFVQAVKSMQAGENPNLGDGILGESTRAEDTEIFKELVGQGADPNIIGQRLQEELGAPITSDYREQVANFGSYTTDKGTVPLSIGRNIAVELFEPDEWQFNLMSTIFDGAWRLGTDPALWLGSGYAKMAKQVKMAPSALRTKPYIESKEALNAARTAGLTDWMYRKVINKPALDEYFRKTDSGYRIAEYLANASTHKEVQSLLKYQGGAALTGAIKKAQTAEEVIDLLVPHMGTAIKHRLDATSLLTRAVPRRVAGGLYSAAKGKGFLYGYDVGVGTAVKSLGADGTALGQMLATQFPIDKLEVRNLDRTYKQIDEWMDFGGVSAAKKEEVLDKISAMASEQAVTGELDFVKHFNTMVDIWNNPAGTGVLNEIMSNFEKAGIPAAALKGVEKWWASVDETRKYFVTLGQQEGIAINTGQIIPGQKFKMLMVDGKELAMPQPTAQLISEYLAEGFIPMPDIKTFVKLMGPLRTFIGKVMTLGVVDTDTVRKFMNKPLKRAIDLGIKRELDDVAHGSLKGLEALEEAFYRGFVVKATRVTKRGEFIDDAINLQEAAITRLANFTMQKVWKPLVLLRPAWTARVIGEEQMRMAAADLDSMFYHPMSWFGWALGKTPAERSKIMNGLSKVTGQEYALGKYSKFKDRFAKGMYDITGNITAEHYDHIAALSRGHGGWLGVDPERSRYWKYLNKPDGDDLIGFDKAWARNLFILEKDPLVKELAKFYNVRNPNTSLDNIVDRFVNGDLRYIRESFAGNVDEAFSNSKRIVLENDQKAREYVESVYARIHYETGGSYELINKRTKQVYQPGDVVNPEEWTKDAFTYKITKQGDTELIKEFLGAVAAEGGQISQFTLRGMYDPALLKRGIKQELKIFLGEGESQNAYRMFSQWLGSKKIPNRPAVVKAQRFDVSHEWGNSLDAAIEGLFDTFMSKPTNMLSRSPAFRQFYWDEIADMLPYMDAGLRDQVQRMAYKANVMKGSLGKKIKKGIKEQKTGNYKATLLDADITKVDEMAKAQSLVNTQQLLYDLNKRHVVSEILRNVIPFAEVYIEVLGTWSRLLRQNPTIPRYLQMGVDGAKKKGFIYTDPTTGEEFYNFSQFGDKMLTKWALQQGDEDPRGVEARIQTPSRLEGLNMITGGIGLGLGPLATVPINFMLPPGELTPTVEKIVFPFGRPDDVSKQFIPSHMQKFWSLWSNDPERAKLYEDTMIDVTQVMIDAGLYDDSTPELQEKSMKRIKQAANRIVIYRGATQAILPTQAFIRYEYKAVAPEGKLYLSADQIEENPEWFETTLFEDAYWRALAKYNGDELRATDWFIKQFGFNPMALTTSKSQENIPTSYTEEGLFFANANPDMFKKYPNAAYWLFPDAPTDEFYLTAYTNTFVTGARTARNLDQWYQDGYKTGLFNLAKENLRRSLYENPNMALDAQARDNLFKMGVIELADEYDIVDYPSISDTPLPSQIDELTKMLKREKNTVVKLPDGTSMKLSDMPVYNALEAYLVQRDIMLGGLQFRTGNPSATLARFDAANERAILQDVADKLIRLSPDFYFWFYNVGVKEFKDADNIELPLFDGFEL